MQQPITTTEEYVNAKDVVPRQNKQQQQGNQPAKQQNNGGNANRVGGGRGRGG